MYKIERSIHPTSKVVLEENRFLKCQASINSDGNITLRNYNSLDKNTDELYVLSEAETRAIFELMCKLKQFGINNDLPF